MLNATFWGHFLNGLLMILLPVGLGLWLEKRLRLGWRLWWIGAATFVLSQVGHIPFNIGVQALFDKGIVPLPPPSWQVIFSAGFLGLSSGIFEEWFRYAAYRWWAKDARSWRRGVMLGAGHGGIEAIILGLLVLLTFVNMVAVLDMDLTTRVPVEQLELANRQIEQYWSLPWYKTLVAALERSFTLIFHISASLLVLQAFVRKHLRWVWLSVGWHALANAGAVYIIRMGGGYWSEVWIGLLALLSLGIIFLLRSPEPAVEAQPIEPSQPVVAPAAEQIHLPPPDEDLQNLEKTRYN